MTMVKKALFYLALAALMCGLVSCGSGDDRAAAGDPAPQPKRLQEETDSPVTAPEENFEEDIEEETGEVKGPDRIQSVTLAPEILHAFDRLTARARVSPPPVEGERLSYVFFVNGEEVAEQDENSLPPFSFRREDTVFVDGVLYRGDQELERKRSDVLIVLNSKPEFDGVDFPQISGPGTYEIKVRARDADDDTLNFSLAGDPGIPMGMEIDPSSGIITYEFDKPPDSRVKFKVLVNDGRGGENWRELAINFSEKTVRKKEEDAPGG